MGEPQCVRKKEIINGDTIPNTKYIAVYHTHTAHAFQKTIFNLHFNTVTVINNIVVFFMTSCHFCQLSIYACVCVCLCLPEWGDSPLCVHIVYFVDYHDDSCIICCSFFLLLCIFCQRSFSTRFLQIHRDRCYLFSTLNVVLFSIYYIFILWIVIFYVVIRWYFYLFFVSVIRFDGIFFWVSFSSSSTFPNG